jgi:hypothetical protein
MPHILALLLALAAAPPAPPQTQVAVYGPYHGVFIPEGFGLQKEMPGDNGPLAPASAWSMYCWIRSEEQMPARTLLAGFGNPDPLARSQRYLAIFDGRLAFWAGVENLVSGTSLRPRTWQFAAVTFDGTTLRLYLDGEEVARKEATLTAALPVIHIAPDRLPWPEAEHFGGRIARFTVTSRLLAPDELRPLPDEAARLELLPFQAGSPTWPISSHGYPGLRAPQDPATLPQSLAPLSKATAKPARTPALAPRGANEWSLAGGWKLAAAREVAGDGPEISRPGFRAARWLDATVPGTVLTTYIDRGVYPDPDFGLDNFAIPETLNKQDYWYRVEFTAPASLAGRRLTLTFNGINYAAEVWFNGARLGEIKGAFIRGAFDITRLVEPGAPNALAVRISPPSHPGIPHEQSVKAGSGLNGGIECIDGPTFFPTEGWDWLPGIRDRNTGIWQEVTLRATGQVKIGDPRVATTIEEGGRAAVIIRVPLRNDSAGRVAGELKAFFEGVQIRKRVALEPGETQVTLAPDEFPQLSIEHPRLWWPNGYGKPELYELRLAFAGAHGESDTKKLRFGIREITYELTLLDASGRLRRVEYDPTAAGGEPAVDIAHERIVKTVEGFVMSLHPGAERSPGIRALEDRRASPFLVIRVNGIRVAVRGGNWGLDDALKRVSRAELEPYVRLHRDANLNMIRNWCGQSTEEALFDLADEYGLLVWNDFWITTQDSNLDPADTALFLANARDTLLRFRNHPSIAVWCGRNEGVPSPPVNEGLDAMIRALDGTRMYLPNSRLVNLQESGPWRYGEPLEFFTTRGQGFSTELGLPSPPTIEAIRAMLPKADQWPPNDTWAYHDWHSGPNGGGPMMDAMEQQLGPPLDLEDFERKAQLINYVTHRALFEGFNAHLWAPNTGRLMWMSQPAWPSMVWQLFSHDYDTHASFYGVKMACEPVHVQLNLPHLATAAVNTTTNGIYAAALRARVYAPDGRLLYEHEETLDLPADSARESFRLELPSELVFVKLELRDARGKMLSENFYWQAAGPAAYRKLNELPPAKITARASRAGSVVRVELANEAGAAALMIKLTLRQAGGGPRVLPAYASDNYISLLPGERRRIEIELPSGAAKSRLELGVRGWNVQPQTVPLP